MNIEESAWLIRLYDYIKAEYPLPDFNGVSVSGGLVYIQRRNGPRALIGTEGEFREKIK